MIILLLCVKGNPKSVGKKLLESLHTDVYSVDKAVFKIKKWNRCNLEKAVAHNQYLNNLASELNFLPEYYGTVISAVKKDESLVSVIASFHQYAEPLNFRSLSEVQGTLSIISEAQSKGYFMDLKPSNFGRVGRKILYLDEYGIGKSLLPPDVMESLERLVQKLATLQDWISKGKARKA